MLVCERELGGLLHQPETFMDIERFCVRHAVVTGMNIISILYVVLAGSPFGQSSNLTPFAPHSIPGIFAGAAIVYFSFVGFDLVATVAEEVWPAHYMPGTVTMKAVR